MDNTQTLRLLGLAGICVGVTLASGCKTRYYDGDASFAGNEATVFAEDGTAEEWTAAGKVEAEGGAAGVRVAEPEVVISGENPMPAALAPVQPADVKYPTPQPPKAPEYWQQHADPYAGMTRPSGAAGVKNGAAASSGQTVYIVRNGDTLGDIAKKHGVSLKSVKAVNGGINYDRIVVGQKIYIPAKSAATTVKSTAAASGNGVHVVKQGEILGRIARQYGVKVADLKAANGLTSDKIIVGQKLKIPGKSASAATTAKPPKKETHKESSTAKPAEAKSAPEKPAETFAAPEVTPPELPNVEAPKIEVDKPAVEAEKVPEAKPAVVNGTRYVVKEDEDVFSIAVKWSLTSNEILAANPGISKTPAPGTILILPTGGDAK